PTVLADVGDPEIAGRAIEAESPRIAKAERPDLAARAGAIHERIRRRDRVPRGAVDVDAQNFSEQRREILRAIAGIAGASAVAEADVEVVVGTEGEVAA